MIKIETIGMLDTAKNDPTLTHTADVKNYSFLTKDDEVYLIANTITGDKAYSPDEVIAKGDFLNAFLLKAWEGQKLVIDGKHITDALSGVSVGDTLVPQEDGTLKKGDAKGVCLKVTDKGVRLTEEAVKAKVVIAASGE